VLGAIVWCSIIVTVGYLLGDELYQVVQMTHQASRWIAIAIVLVSIGIFVYWWRERNQAVTRPEP
jgi:membrane protein DedA with SNARE-associated domain